MLHLGCRQRRTGPVPYCVRGTRTQLLICLACSVHYWVSCAINRGVFFRDCICVGTHLPRYEAIAFFAEYQLY